MQKRNEDRIMVSIILTITEFSEKELKNSIHSVLNQKTYGTEKSHSIQLSPGSNREEGFFLQELILLDLTADTSCSEWLEAAYADEEKLILLKAQEPITRGQGINRAAEAALGEYLAFMESGTQWAAQKLEKQVSYLEKNRKVDWIYGIAAIRGKEKAYQPNPGLPPYKKAGNLFYDLLRENTVSLDTMLIRRDTFLKLGGMDEELPALVDEEFLLRLSLAHTAAYVEQVMAVISLKEGAAESCLAVRMLMLSEFREELSQSMLTEEVIGKLWQEAKKQRLEGIFWEYASLLKEDELFTPILERIWQEKHPERELILSKEPTVAGVVNCVGCCGCEAICPVDAIIMKPNEEGFLYPKVDEETCILCGKCLKVCPTQKPLIPLARPEKCYAVRGRDEAAKDSSSGGVFPLLAEQLLNRGGWVAGAVYGKDFQVKHMVSNQRSDIFRMRSSKYVQSDSRGVFAQVRRLLEEEKEVLFTGCVCQVAGLKAFLGKDYAKLYTADVICHGVPSPKVYQSYLKEHEGLAGPIREVNFRKKQALGWKSGVYIGFENGKAYVAKGYDPYMAVFLNDWGLRDCCYSCEFKQAVYSDLTLGDFWGIDRLRKDKEIGKGTSLVTVNTAKGAHLLGEVRRSAQVWEAFSTEQAAAFNPSLKRPVQRKKFRDIFMNTFLEEERKPVQKRSLQQTITRAFGQIHFDLALVLWWSPNYGNALTNYALYKTLEKEYSVLAIDNVNLYPGERFGRFAREHYQLSSDYFPQGARELIGQSCDTFIVGSDQTWNYHFEQQCRCGKYFQLDFVPKNKKKLSYAASFGMEGAEPPTEGYAQLYRQFKGISVREQFGVESCRRLYGATAAWVLDPVFLLEAKEYEPLVKRAEEMRRKKLLETAKAGEEEPFIMAYLLNPTPQKRRACKEIQRLLGGIPIINVSENSAREQEKNRHILEFDHVLGNIEVEDWVYYMNRAEFVVTDSFHGTCFSVIFQKRFLSFVNRQPGRFQVFDRFSGLSGRIIKPEDMDALLENMEAYVEQMDYSTVEKELEAARQESLGWLKKQLKS